MNFLAHLALTDRSPEALLGSVLPDLLRAPVTDLWPPVVRRYARLHLDCDYFTDRHPAFRRSTARLVGNWRHYAGILVDIYYDHLLARDWEHHFAEPLADFARTVYAAWPALPARLPQPLPPRVADALARMAEQDWLCTYPTVAGVELALTRLSRRSRRGLDLAPAVNELQQQDPGLREDFQVFWPELVALVTGEVGRPAALRDDDAPDHPNLHVSQ